MRDRWLLLLALVLLMTPSGRAQKQNRTKRSRLRGSNAWVEATLRKMTLREKLGQLLMVYFYGQFASTESAAYRELLHEVDENKVGGFILGTTTWALGIERGHVYAAAVLANQLQRRAKVPLLVGADLERGAAMRIVEGTSFPTAMGIAAGGNPRDAYTMGKITALDARAAGINWIFAPVADVNDNPANPIINVRSFGEDPNEVAEYVTEFIRGVQENGALATAKHFPGHGDTSVDSHLALPVVQADRARLDTVNLVPFRSAIAAGVDAIMPGHLVVPALEPDPALPATLSPKILTGLLRKELGFNGLIVTDALDMGGVTALYPPGEAAVRSIAAGTDVLLIPPNPDAALAALEQAIASGRLPMSRVEDAVRRILSAKARLGLEKNRFIDVEKLNGAFARPEFAAQAQEMADRGVTLLRDQPHLLPLDASRPLRVLLVEISGDPDTYPGPDFEREIRWRVDSLEVLRADTRFAKIEALKLPSSEAYDVAIAALFVRVADRKGNVGLPDDEAAFVSQLLAGPKPVVVAAFGSPYLIERFPSAKTWIASFGVYDVAQTSTARALFGQVAIGGQIPVSVPGVVKRGDGLRVGASPMTLQPPPVRMGAQMKPAFDVLDRAVADQVFPGGVLAVGYHNKLLVRPFGKLTYDAKAPRVAGDTIYDLASLTKPVVTTTAVMMLATDGRLDLEVPLSRYLPEWASGPDPDKRKKVTLRQLLLHTSGLPAHRDYFAQAKGKQAVLARIFAEPLVSEPGTKVEYSDLGFMLLGEIVERFAGQSLDAFARQEIFGPLGMRDSMFQPARGLRARIAPTENDVDLRKRLLQGEVDDANAWAMGGVAGHAGLFSTAGDLAAFAQMLLNGGIYAHRRLLTRAAISQFTARQTIGGSARTLGWDVPTDPSATGKYFSARSFGHNGYTGTSLWIDPEKDLFVILLTNRVHPTADNDKIRAVRPALHDAVIEALGLGSRQASGRAQSR
jgi:beta-N-acetylhexosaminidase